jgi:hypothetical protein
MLEAQARGGFLADADLSMPISELKRFLDAARRAATSSSGRAKRMARDESASRGHAM